MGKNFHYGGQAVIDGVMMRGSTTWAVAVRAPDQSIAVETRAVQTITKRYPFLKWPLIRGSVVLVESLLIGIKALSISASVATEEEEKPITPWEMAGSIAVAMGLAVALFIVLPIFIAHLFTPLVSGAVAQNFLEGALRVAAFLGYIAAVSYMPDIRRVFQYHGAEHKVINAYEAGAKLESAEVKKFSPLHARCGTSFLLLVILLKVLIFSFIATDPLWWRVASRILLLPIIAGLAYEGIKLTAKYAQSYLSRILMAPGLLVQRMTTREPDEEQIEVALKAFQTVRTQEEGEHAVQA